jgi:putative DNA primase/helicase
MSSMDETTTQQKPTRAALRAALSIAEPPDDDPFDLQLERSAPRFINGNVIPSKPRATLRNLDRILRGDPVFAGAIRWNDMAAHIEWGGRPIEDYRVIELALAIAERHEVEFAMGDLHGMVELVAREHSYHPVREWLDGLAWDGTERLDGWLTRWLRVDDSPLVREYARRFCVGAIARVMQPGCKLDTALVLHGVQSAGKSSFCAAFAHREDWFSDTKLEWDSKDRFQQIQGVWLYEMGELSGMGKADTNSVKNFLSSQVDKFRPSHARHVVRRPRQCAFIGTTNDKDCLSDPTGDRRFWVVTTRLERMGIDLDLVRAEHEQVWAEAVAAYRAGERWHLSRELDGARHEANAAYRREDPLTQSLATFADEQRFFTVSEFWTHLELPLTQLTASVVSRIGLIMAEIDTHEHVQVRRGGARVRGYRRKERAVTP